MAIMTLPSRMAFWKITFDGYDMTTLFRDHVESISVKRSILPPPTHGKKEHAPSEADISIISKSYLENLFQEGTKVKIYMGNDRILTEKALIFSGVINTLPDGEAQEMIKYNVHAFGGEMSLSLEERSRSFLGKTKTQIVRDILGKPDYMDFDATIDIADNVVPSGIYASLQIAKTDLQFLTNMAAKWGCRIWIDMPNKFYFVDTDKIQTYKPEYVLGYRTDKASCNVESVSWKHDPQPVGLVNNNGGFLGLDQLGEIKGIENFKLIALGKTWRVKPEVVAQIKKSGKPESEIAKILAYTAEKTVSWDAYAALYKYYRIVDGDDTSQKFSKDANSGMKITVKLNHGDPDLTPPRKAVLYHGSLNPRADSSRLPAFLERWSLLNGSIFLNINETILSYRQGRLESELICDVGNIET